MNFDGITERLCKFTRQRLTKFLDCSYKWAKFNCQQAEIAKKSYENIDDGLSRRKITRWSVLEALILPQRNPQVLSEIGIICGRDVSQFLRARYEHFHWYNS